MFCTEQMVSSVNMAKSSLPSCARTHAENIPIFAETFPSLQKTLMGGICIEYTFGV